MEAIKSQSNESKDATLLPKKSYSYVVTVFGALWINVASKLQHELIRVCCGWVDTGPFPDPEVVMTVLLQTELQVVMDEGATQAVPTTASPSTLGDSNASSNKTQSGQSVPPRPPNFNSQPSLDAWNSSALNPRPARQPPTSKRKDPESRSFNDSWLYGTFLLEPVHFAADVLK